MYDVTFQRMTLEQAISHARTNARTPKDRRAYVLFYLRCEEKGYTKARAFRRANLVRALSTRARAELLITSLLENLRSEEQLATEGMVDPMSNTGPTEEQLASSVLESYVAGKG